MLFFYPKGDDKMKCPCSKDGCKDRFCPFLCEANREWLKEYKENKHR